MNEEWRQQGISLIHDGNEVLELRYQGQLIARFSQSGVDIENYLYVVGQEELN